MSAPEIRDYIETWTDLYKVRDGVLRIMADLKFYRAMTIDAQKVLAFNQQARCFVDLVDGYLRGEVPCRTVEEHIKALREEL